MYKSSLCLSLAVAATLLPAVSHATIHTTVLGTPLTTPENPNGANSDGTGVWFNPLTGYAEVRGFLFPNPLFEDGKFQLVFDTQYVQDESEAWIEGLISRGNNMIDGPLGDPAKFDANISIDGSSGTVDTVFGGYPDLGPTFGYWTAGDYGFLGLVIRNPAGATSSDLFYGYAEIKVNDDYSVTLYSMAYNDVEGQAITTVSSVPEPSTMTLAGLGLGALGYVYRRRRA